MRIERGDYAIIDVEGKNKLVKLLEVGRQNLGVLADKSMASRDTEIRLPFAADQLIANLGTNPRAGSVYGQRAEPWRQSEVVAPWGTIHYFRAVERGEHRALLSALNAVGEELASMRLLDTLPVEIHVRPKNGKHAGSYHHRPAEDIDIVTYHVDNLGEDAEYVVWHEDAHRVWFTLLDQDVRARWMRFYLESIQLDNYELSDVEQMGRDFRDNRSQIATFRRDLDPDDAALFDDCIGWITGWHSISKHNIDVLMNDDPNEILGLWPDREIERMDKDLIISDYAKKNPEEFFAEAWAFHYTGRELSGRVANAVERTYESIG